MLQKVCYEANVGTLIAQGFLCRLRSKIGDVQPDLDKVKRNSGGDYITASLAEAVDQADVVARAIRSAMQIIVAEGRKSIIFFCVDVEHCRRVSNELRKYGLEAPIVTAATPHGERDRIAEAFKQGRYHAICNVNVYTEGFNAKRVDAIVLLRPTLSKGLYVQMVGRGLRPHPEKADCLVLDYAHCIDEHGPIDCIDEGAVKLATCGQCGDVFSRAIRTCPNCGWAIPKEIVEREESEDREKRLHEAEASQRAILGSEPETLTVDDVQVNLHRKPGSPDSIRVQYRCGLTTFREWICLGHAGYAERKARKWWWERFGNESKTITVEDALGDMLLGHRIKSVTKTITVVRRGKYSEIVSHGIIRNG
jgi:DNA repair protein RadD